MTYSYDVNQRMHCTFEDVESGRVLEVDLSLDRDGKVSDSDVKEKEQQLAAVDNSKVE